jgi:hypothetical protein
MTQEVSTIATENAPSKASVGGDRGAWEVARCGARFVWASATLPLITCLLRTTPGTPRHSPAAGGARRSQIVRLATLARAKRGDRVRRAALVIVHSAERGTECGIACVSGRVVDAKQDAAGPSHEPRSRGGRAWPSPFRVAAWRCIGG